MKTIDTLIPDIHKLIKSKEDWFTEELSVSYGLDVGKRLREQFQVGQRGGTLRLSQMGPKCPCALWYSYHHPELAQPLPAWAEIKYSFGHMIEALAIALAKAAGHTVTGEQDALELDGIVGHRDCVIDGVTVDVKSTSSFGFNKFKGRNFQESDNFGYLDQLDGYVLAAHSDPLVLTKDKGYLFAIDKQLGHMCLYEHTTTPDRERSLRDRIQAYKGIVALPYAPPCECGTEPVGASGNVKLDTKASYSPYKYCCKPYLRTFLYASGPVYLTQVKKVPDVTEVDKDGKYVYH